MKLKISFFTQLALLCGLFVGPWVWAQTPKAPTPPKVRYAKGFSLHLKAGYTLLEVHQPWPGAQHSYRYILLPRGQQAPAAYRDWTPIQVPLRRVIATSTTHLPSIETLGQAPTLVGFPNTDYISSPALRRRIDQGLVADVGHNRQLNIEKLMALQPDALIGYGVEGETPGLQLLRNRGIPIVFNGDWIEQDPLGKAEWLLFFGALYQQLDAAQQQFSRIEKAYLSIKKSAQACRRQPLVLAGSMWEGVWYAPYANSWAGAMLRDAGCRYVWGQEQGEGSLALSIEKVLPWGEKAEVWLASTDATRLTTLQAQCPHSKRFKAFRQRKVYSFSRRKGAKGGVWFYELGPNRPDLVLKDLVKITHPELFPGYKPYFYSALQP